MKPLFFTVKKLISLIDAHNHYFKDAYTAENVNFMLSCAAKFSDFKSLENAAFINKKIIPCFGIHPWYAEDFNDMTRKYLENILLKYPKSLIGEIGLDNVKNIEFSLQKDVLTAQLKIASIYKRPVILHCVKAYEQMLNILTKYPVKAFLLHSYNGNENYTKRFTKINGYFSINTKILKENNSKAVKVLKSIPINKLLLETDASDSYCLDNIKLVYEKVAQILGINIESLAKIFIDNFERLISYE